MKHLPQPMLLQRQCFVLFFLHLCPPFSHQINNPFPRFTRAHFHSDHAYRHKIPARNSSQLNHKHCIWISRTLWRPDPCIIEHDFDITKTAETWTQKHYEKCEHTVWISTHQQRCSNQKKVYRYCMVYIASTCGSSNFIAAATKMITR